MLAETLLYWQSGVVVTVLLSLMPPVSSKPENDPENLVQEIAVSEPRNKKTGDQFSPIGENQNSDGSDLIADTLNKLPKKMLDLESLFESIDLFAPQILMARSVIEEAEGRVLSAEGFYDTRINGDYYGRFSGFYGGQYGNINASQQIPWFNSRIYGGYRLSQGSFPIYEDQFFTNSGGEIKVGGEISLLRNRDIDKNRLELTNSALNVSLSRQRFEQDRLALKAQSARLMVDWTFWKETLSAYQTLYKMALTRENALRRASDAGNIPALALQENRQLVLSRQSEILAAQTNLVNIAGQLALFWRDQKGDPIQDHIPDFDFFPESDPFYDTDFDNILEEAFIRRPDLGALDLESRKIRNKIGLAENDQQPDLTFGYEISQEFGSGSITREGTDNIAQLQFRLPIGTSQARGKEISLRAKLRGIEAKTQLIRDEIKTALSATDSQITLARRQISVAQEEVSLTERLFQAEERRFTAGLSSFFELNTLERRLGDARLRLAVAHRDYHYLLVRFYRITGNLWY